MSKQPAKAALGKGQIISPQQAEAILHEGRVQQVQIRKEVFQGPLPSPDILVGYNQAFPDAAERIVTMAESAQNHKQLMENRMLTEQAKGVRYGQVFAFLIAIVGMICGTYLIAHGASASGLASIFGPLTGLAGIHLYNNYKDQQKKTNTPERPKQGGAPTTAQKTDDKQP